MYLLPEYAEKQNRIAALQAVLESTDADENTADRAAVEAELAELLG